MWRCIDEVKMEFETALEKKNQRECIFTMVLGFEFFSIEELDRRGVCVTYQGTVAYSHRNEG